MGKIAAVIPAAGQGKRMGGPINKQLMQLGDKPVLAHTLETFQACSLIDQIVIVAFEEEIKTIQSEIVNKFKITKTSHIVPGGKERQDSVRLGLAVLESNTEWVVVHDGARPLLLGKKLEEILERAFVLNSVVAAVPTTDTIKQIDDQGKVVATLPRNYLQNIQTPQIFRRDIITRAHQHAYETGFKGPDDGSLVEAMGEDVFVVSGSSDNIKITNPEDIKIALEIIKGRELA